MAVTTVHPEVHDEPANRAPLAAPRALALPRAPAAGANRLLIPAGAPLPPARRLVVLVPDANVDETALAARIWHMATPARLDVLFLGIIRTARAEPAARRRLASLAAITRDPLLHVGSRLIAATDWLSAVGSVGQADDVIVCPAELSTVGFRRRPLAQALLARFEAGVYVLAGFYPQLPADRPQWLKQLAAWAPPLVILAVFFVIQADLARATTGSLQTVMLALTVGVEFFLISAWEHYLGSLR